MGFKYLKTLAMPFIIPALQNSFIHGIIFNNALVRRIALAMIKNSAFTVSYTENPFWYQKSVLRQNRNLIDGQPIVEFNAADNCRL